jgi:hypothetical protein
MIGLIIPCIEIKADVDIVIFICLYWFCGRLGHLIIKRTTCDSGYQYKDSKKLE